MLVEQLDGLSLQTLDLLGANIDGGEELQLLLLVDLDVFGPRVYLTKRGFVDALGLEGSVSTSCTGRLFVLSK